MTTWRALMSPSRNVSLLESNKDSIDNRIQTQVKGKHAKTITQSTNLSQLKPTIKRGHSNSFIDQAFIQSSSNDLLEQIRVVDDDCQMKEIKEILIQNQMNLIKLQKKIDSHDYNNRQIQALQKQIMYQRSKYNISINTKINVCQKQLQDIQIILQKKK